MQHIVVVQLSIMCAQAWGKVRLVWGKCIRSNNPEGVSFMISPMHAHEAHLCVLYRVRNFQILCTTGMCVWLFDACASVKFTWCIAERAIVKAQIWRTCFLFQLATNKLLHIHSDRMIENVWSSCVYTWIASISSIFGMTHFLHTVDLLVRAGTLSPTI